MELNKNTYIKVIDSKNNDIKKDTIIKILDVSQDDITNKKVYTAKFENDENKDDKFKIFELRTTDTKDMLEKITVGKDNEFIIFRVESS